MGVEPTLVHPFALVGDEEMGVVELWQAWRAGMGGPGHLPFGGGAAEQPAVLMEAFHLLSWAAEKLKEKEDEPEYEVVRRVRRS